MLVGVTSLLVARRANRRRDKRLRNAVRRFGMASDRIGYQLGVGMDYYAFSAASAYAGASAISGLEAFALPGAALAHRASPVGSAAIFYQIDRTQRLTGNVSVRGQAFSTQPSISALGGYQAAF